MRSFLKLVVLLFCVQRGEGRWLRSLLEQREKVTGSSQSSSADQDHSPTGGSGSGGGEDHSPTGGSGSGGGVGQVRFRRASMGSSCGLRSLLLKVRDLGLGYDSDETVLFKYCSGSCPRVRSNHDLTLTNLLLRGALPPPVSEELWHNTPCCRPTHHEDLAFLDNSHRWHKVEKLSAAGCSCVG